jgi:hypothetical protein
LEAIDEVGRVGPDHDLSVARGAHGCTPANQGPKSLDGRLKLHLVVGSASEAEQRILVDVLVARIIDGHIENADTTTTRAGVRGPIGVNVQRVFVEILHRSVPAPRQ